MSGADELRRDNYIRALRHSIWLASLHAQELKGFADIQDKLLSLLVVVDQRREALEDEAEFVAAFPETLGPETAARGAEARARRPAR